VTDGIDPGCRLAEDIPLHMPPPSTLAPSTRGDHSAAIDNRVRIATHDTGHAGAPAPEGAS